MKKQQLFDRKTKFYKTGLNKLVVENVEAGKKVLDVGCSQGKLGYYLKNNKKAIVFGIDISERAVRKASRVLDGAYRLDVETDDLPFAKKSFDIIVCADVLEHLCDPLATLKKLKAYLKNGGYCLISLPNVANIRIRWNLLWGNFDYQKEGIMDDSHFHFFTRKTAWHLLRRAGLEIIETNYSPGFSFFFFQGRIMRFRFLQKVHAGLTKIAPTLFCRQFVILAKSQK